MTDEVEEGFELCKKRCAILAFDGRLMVSGGPGSGKTTIALLKARRLILAGLKQFERILFLSFSNSAVRRIAGSAQSILAHELEDGVENRTYHSFAWDILNAHGYLLSGKRRLHIVAAQDADVRRSSLSADEWLAEQDRLFEEDGLVTYDQFARRAADLLEVCTDLRKLYAGAFPTIFVDEFQDTDEEQYRLIKLLAKHSTVVALGDTEQRIYEWRPGVSATRITDFVQELGAVLIDLGSDNHRSPKTGIAKFAAALLDPTADLPDCAEVKVRRCYANELPHMVKLSAKAALAWARKASGTKDVTLAVAARSRTLVRLLSDILAGTQTVKNVDHGPLAHDVLIDQSQIVLAARVVAHILESPSLNRTQAIGTALRRIADMLKAGGGKTNIKKSGTLEAWAAHIEGGGAKNTKLVVAIRNIFENVEDEPLSGAPTADWLRVRAQLKQTGVDEFERVEEYVRFLRVLRRGSEIEEVLTDVWKRTGTYCGAVKALDEAVQREQILDAVRPEPRITVMTMHQLKAREYDAVVIVEKAYQTFLGRDEKAPYMETRRLLQVSVTRARHCATIITTHRDSTLELF